VDTCEEREGGREEMEQVFLVCGGAKGGRSVCPVLKVPKQCPFVLPAGSDLYIRLETDKKQQNPCL
jgi:hypothetical protein